MTKATFDTKLKNLNPKVKEKALEIADRQRKNLNVSEEEAMKKGLKEALEWFYNMEG